MNRFATRHGLSLIERLVGFSPIYLFEIVDGVDAADKLTEVDHDAQVLAVTLNWLAEFP